MTKVFIGSAVSGGAIQSSPYASQADLAAVKSGATPLPLSDSTVISTGSTTSRALKDIARDVDGATSAQVQPFLSKIKRAIDDVTVLVLGDSTGNGTDEWVYLVGQWLGTRYPTHTIKYTLWGGASYPATTTLSTGTGSRTITIYNGSVAGSRSVYPLGGLWATMVAAVPTPDLIFVSYGHNQGAASVAWRADYIALTESLAEEHPDAGIVLILQNPSSADNYQAQRNAVYERIAQDRGYGAVNVWQAFLDYGTTWTTDLMLDTVHPNPAGSLIWAAEVERVLSFSRSASPRGRSVSSVTVAGRQVIQNGDFSLWSGTNPDGWTLVGSPTVAQDSTNFESPAGWGLKVTAAGGAPGYVWQELPHAAVLGKWVTVLARVFIANGATPSAGMVSLEDGVTSVNSYSNSSGGFTGGAFRWVVVSRKFAAGASTARVYLYGDASSTNGSATFASVSVVIGSTPLGLPMGVTGGVRPGRLNSAGLASSSVLYSATGAPNSSYGAAGDYFFRSDVSAIYNKFGSTWRPLGPTVSADRGDTSQTIQCGIDAEIELWATTLTANRTITLDTSRARNGDHFRIVRTGLGAFTIDVGPGLKTMPSATAAFVDVFYNGSAWVLAGYGAM